MNLFISLYYFYFFVSMDLRNEIDYYKKTERAFSYARLISVRLAFVVYLSEQTMY